MAVEEMAVVAAVYIPPDANSKLAIGYVLAAMEKWQNSYPEGVFIIASDFNHVSLKTVLPNFDQHGKFATRGANILDIPAHLQFVTDHVDKPEGYWKTLWMNETTVVLFVLNDKHYV